MNCYHHLSMEERESLLIGLQNQESLSQIATKLGRSRSTLSREIRRNGTDAGGYRSAAAHKRYLRRRRKCVRPCKLSEPLAAAKVTELLKQRWSPEQISERLRKEGNCVQVSFKSIYRSINEGILDPSLKSRLRLRRNALYGKHKTSRCGHLNIDHSIHERPKSVDTRTRIGDWESDTVRGANWSGCIAAHVERKSRYVLLSKLPDRTHKAFTEATIAAFKNIPANRCRSFTVDHGKEFAGHRVLSSALNCKVYFCDPMAPWQRGTNENTNGLLRQYLPKRTSFAAITQADVDAIALLLNRRPRKSLGWKTPEEVFFNKVLHLT